jgi:hypothetical protein
MVHEWAKLRWGVYEEHGYPGDPKFPMFYLKSTWTVNGPESKVVINLCLNEDPVGYEQVLGQKALCSISCCFFQFHIFLVPKYLTILQVLGKKNPNKL